MPTFYFPEIKRNRIQTCCSSFGSLNVDQSKKQNLNTGAKSKSTQSCYSLGSWQADQRSSFELIIGRLSATLCIDPEQGMGAHRLVQGTLTMIISGTAAPSVICITLACPKERNKQQEHKFYKCYTLHWPRARQGGTQAGSLACTRHPFILGNS